MRAIPQMNVTSAFNQVLTATIASAAFMFMSSVVQAETIAFTKSIETLTQYRERPLFLPSRRPFPDAAPDEENVAPITLQPLNAVLLGLISSSDGNGVVVLRLDGQTDAQRVRIGETVNGWQLDRIESRNAQFSSDGQNVTLTFPQGDEANALTESGVSDLPVGPIILPTPDPTQP